MNLILSPHLDDEVLGCASFLNSGSAILYGTVTHPDFPQVADERDRLLKQIGVMARTIVVALTSGTNYLDTVPQALLIHECERALKSYRADTVLVPSPSYNQDHRALYDAMLTACRPHDKNHFVKRVLAYEEPETFGALRKPDAFKPTYFRTLDIERKLALYHVYASQVRGHRSDAHIRAIAAVRGMQANLEYAEAFEVLRWVE